MARHSAAGRSSIAGTNVRAQFSLFAAANNGANVREIGISNTTSTAFAVALVRFSAATNVGSGLTEANWDPGKETLCTAFAGHTGDATPGEVIRQWTVGASVGSGVIWTFGDSGLVIDNGTGNGIGVIIPTGNGQISDFYIDWDE